MSFWSKLLTVGGKALGAAKTGAKASAKSMGNSVIHPSQTLNHAGKAVKTATVGGAVGYVGWEKLTTDKSVTRIVSTRVRDKDCVKNRVKRAKIVRFTLC